MGCFSIEVPFAFHFAYLSFRVTPIPEGVAGAVGFGPRSPGDSFNPWQVLIFCLERAYLLQIPGKFVVSARLVTRVEGLNEGFNFVSRPRPECDEKKILRRMAIPTKDFWPGRVVLSFTSEDVSPKCICGFVLSQTCHLWRDRVDMILILKAYELELNGQWQLSTQLPPTEKQSFQAVTFEEGGKMNRYRK